MPKQKLIISLVVAAVVVVAGWGIHQAKGGGNSTGPSADQEGIFLPELRAQLNDVVRLEMHQGENSLRVHKQGEQWVADDMQSYPVKFESVREFLIQLASLKDAEKKTSNPARHADLGLATPADPDPGLATPATPSAPGTTVTTRLQIWTSAEKPLVELLLGNTRYQPTTGIYLRRAGEDQCWSALGQLRPVTDVKRWMDTNVVSLSTQDLASVQVSGDGAYLIQRADADSPYTLDLAPPEGRALNTASPFSALTASLSWTSFEQVEAASAERYQLPPERTVVWTTFDGTTTTVQLWRLEDGGCWARFEQDGRAELEPWAYSFPESKAKVWFQQLEDWLEPLPEEPPADEGTPPDEDTAPDEGVPPDDGVPPEKSGDGGGN